MSGQMLGLVRMHKPQNSEKTGGRDCLRPDSVGAGSGGQSALDGVDNGVAGGGIHGHQHTLFVVKTD